jgi:threonine dehydrogenase-like Zn-dependent dehydrogenase
MIEHSVLLIMGCRKPKQRRRDRPGHGRWYNGMLCAFTLQSMKANVYVADIDPVKLQFAQSLGFTNTLLNDDPNHFTELVQRVTNHDGFDIVVEAVGASSTFLSCIDAAAYGGRVVQIGVVKQDAVFNFTQIQKKELHIHGSRNALEEDFHNVLAMLSHHDIPLERLISRTYPFTEASDAFEYFSQGSCVRMKIIWILPGEKQKVDHSCSYTQRLGLSLMQRYESEIAQWIMSQGLD